MSMLTRYAKRPAIALTCLAVMLLVQPAVAFTACGCLWEQRAGEAGLPGERECCGPRWAAGEGSESGGPILEAEECGCECVVLGRGSGDEGGDRPAASSPAELWGAVLSEAGFRPAGSRSLLSRTGAGRRWGPALVSKGARAPPVI